MRNNLRLCETPFTDKMLSKKNLNLTSFHALPINRLKSLEKSKLLSKYTSLLGANYADSEITYTGNTMDNPVLPNDVLKESQQLTEIAFGSKKTFYITMGTTISNYISILGSVKSNERVLADRNCHQSIHFALKINKNKVDYSNNLFECEDSGRTIIDVENFLEKYKNAFNRGAPYKLVILNGCSYEGVIYNLEPLIEECLKINDKVTFFIDEAWFAHGYFHDYYKKYSAMDIANRLNYTYPYYDINIISTQSAHKSLSALRQGSYIHINGSSKIIDNICNYKYMLHTTSPNYSILSSLELSRAQMVLEGDELINDVLNESLRITKEFSDLTEIYINPIEENNYFFIDPTKISVNFSKKNVSINIIAQYLLDKGIYVNRKTDTSILFNIHIGLSRKDIDYLIHVLKEIDNKNFNDDLKNTVLDYYVISYPPGTPVIVPGDKMDSLKNEKLNNLKNFGVSLMKIG